MWKFFSLSVFTLLAFTVSTSAQMMISGEVVDVIDGRTVVVALPSGKVKVELQFIDVPETGQQLHDTVKEHLRQLTVGKPAEYRPKTLLRDRAVGQLKIKGVDVSQQMLRDGAAWLVPMQDSGQESSDYWKYATIESAAKKERLGVWSIPGMQPSWVFRAEKELAQRREQNSFVPRSSSSTAAKTNARIKVSPPSNPAFGDVGALLNRYDPESKTGVLSTSFIPVPTNPMFPETESIALDVSYYYKEKDQKKRTGTFVFTAVFHSRTPIFQSNTDLIMLEGEKKIVIARPKRTVSNQGYHVRETLICEISRPMLERVAMNEGIMLKMGQHMIYFTGGRYLLYNLLQVTQ
ncbi:MAG: thermonuclease family protein [Pyrinomonadaceae bacterium]